jgi:hypothetical protein
LAGRVYVGIWVEAFVSSQPIARKILWWELGSYLTWGYVVFAEYVVWWDKDYVAVCKL